MDSCQVFQQLVHLAKTWDIRARGNNGTGTAQIESGTAVSTGEIKSISGSESDKSATSVDQTSCGHAVQNGTTSESDKVTSNTEQSNLEQPIENGISAKENKIIEGNEASNEEIKALSSTLSNMFFSKVFSECKNIISAMLEKSESAEDVNVDVLNRIKEFILAINSTKLYTKSKKSGVKFSEDNKNMRVHEMTKENSKLASSAAHRLQCPTSDVQELLVYCFKLFKECQNETLSVHYVRIFAQLLETFDTHKTYTLLVLRNIEQSSEECVPEYELRKSFLKMLISELKSSTNSEVSEVLAKRTVAELVLLPNDELETMLETILSDCSLESTSAILHCFCDAVSNKSDVAENDSVGVLKEWLNSPKVTSCLTNILQLSIDSTVALTLSFEEVQSRHSVHTSIRHLSDLQSLVRLVVNPGNMKCFDQRIVSKILACVVDNIPDCETFFNSCSGHDEKSAMVTKLTLLLNVTNSITSSYEVWGSLPESEQLIIKLFSLIASDSLFVDSELSDSSELSILLKVDYDWKDKCAYPRFVMESIHCQVIQCITNLDWTQENSRTDSILHSMMLHVLTVLDDLRLPLSSVEYLSTLVGQVFSAIHESLSSSTDILNNPMVRIDIKL